ncbi:MAG: MBL fold metallo-hydrolase [Flavobacteriales bacterium]|nr:MBL fold metallo-hydrolase [Flavobacteriales bacterium]
MKITFCGAARQVTGSMYHLQFEDGYQILVDCGLDYERNTKFEKNADFRFAPRLVDAVVLTHAHIDHCGNLPTLFAAGFNGHVFCTEPTLALAEILLQDSARIQLGKKLNRSRKNRRKQVQHEKALFGFKHVKEAIDSMITLPFNKPFKLREGLEFEFISAGHILGAASVVISWNNEDTTQRIAFTGDLGRENNEIVGAPHIPEDLDYLVMEGTYGSRDHTEQRDAGDVLMDFLEDMKDSPHSRLVIPAFSVGRTQSILFTLHKLYREGRLPAVRVFADSPLGQNSGEIHQKYNNWLNKQARRYAEEHGNLFAFRQLFLVEDKEDEETMNSHNAPGVLISSAGMMDGGRIQRHIANNIQNPDATILIAGYCTPGTLGHELLERRSSVRIKGREYPVFARIAYTDVYSAHPDRNELKTYLKKVNAKSRLKKVFLTHGDPESLQNFELFISEGDLDVHIPQKNESVEI